MQCCACVLCSNNSAEGKSDLGGLSAFKTSMLAFFKSSVQPPCCCLQSQIRSFNDIRRLAPDIKGLGTLVICSNGTLSHSICIRGQLPIHRSFNKPCRSTFSGFKTRTLVKLSPSLNLATSSVSQHAHARKGLIGKDTLFTVYYTIAIKYEAIIQTTWGCFPIMEVLLLHGIV